VVAMVGKPKIEPLVICMNDAEELLLQTVPSPHHHVRLLLGPPLGHIYRFVHILVFTIHNINLGSFPENDGCLQYKKNT